MNLEWHVPDTSIPVRQGDILICRDPHKGLFEEICLVITADCDISKGRYGRQLACLRIIPLESYLRVVWADRKLQTEVDNATNIIRDQLNKWNSIRTGTESTLSSAVVIDWVRRSEPKKICADLNIPESEKKKVKTALSSFSAALAVLNDDPAEDKLKKLAEFRSIIKSKDLQKCQQEALQQAKNDKLPEDVFLLPSLPQLDIGPAVVLLREIVGVRHESICYRTFDACNSEMFLRLGRLDPIFKYAVSQAFGTLFSRIGLPEDYEHRCKEAFNQINEIAWG
jgi:hypothetical protein